jgi:hypothetical protein
MSHSFETEQFEQPANKFETSGLESRIKDAQPVSDQASGMTNVELSRINANDVQSAADFKSPEQYAGMRREAEMLKKMQPALAQGTDVETFHQWDQAHHIGQYSEGQHVRGYADVYQSYHGPEAVAVEAKPNGTYDVINGRHRIVAARDAGLQQVPAQVLGR